MTTHNPDCADPAAGHHTDGCAALAAAPLDLTAIEARERKAHDMVRRLCNRRTSGQEWIMHIPARPDSDPDLVIGASLSDVPALLAEVRRLRDVADETLRYLLTGSLVDGDIAEKENRPRVINALVRAGLIGPRETGPKP